MSEITKITIDCDPNSVMITETDTQIIIEINSYWNTRFPSSLIAEAIDQGRIDLTWVNNGVVDYDGINIERSSGNDFTELTTILPGQNSYSDESLDPGITYYYRLRYFKN